MEFIRLGFILDLDLCAQLGNNLTWFYGGFGLPLLHSFRESSNEQVTSLNLFLIYQGTHESKSCIPTRILLLL